MAPPFDFLEKSFMPLIHRMGPSVELKLRRPGFYPAGGGRFHARIEPAKKLSRLDLLERGSIRSRQARVLVSKLPEHVGQRELAVVRDELKWREDECAIEAVQYPVGPGNAVVLAIETEHVTEVFTGFGGVPDISPWLSEVIFHLVGVLGEATGLGAFQKASNQWLSKALLTVSR
jgi:RNA 3'-terminal phosphate cyclase (ATP)